ncbi:MAG TPA: helix-turn-helix transcriptional regulator [Acidocella sp.]|jgi:AraC family transcriptional regulator|nr:helix-turn-helix transcriptional regulator [Acidocella sp.]
MALAIGENGAPGTPRGIMTIDAEMSVPAATVQVVKFDISAPGENFVCRDIYWLDLAVTPRPANSRACFKDHWAPHRFEPLGRVFMAPPDEAMRMRGDSGSQVSILCLLQKDIFRRWLGQELEWTDRRLEATLSVPSEEVQNLLLRLGQEARNPGFASHAYSEAMAVQIAIELNRYYLALDKDNATGGLAGWRLRMIDERLREVRSPPTLTELATLCGLSIRQLTRGFRASRECSIGDYIARTRIDNAKRLLASGESVKSIAFSMGFGSPSGFCYAFRRATGHTPRQYRMQLTASSGTLPH